MFYFGVDYYPEHWAETRWETDAKLMQAAGFNTVRLAEFTWSLLEPEAGVFDFGWLDKAINVLADYGMKVVLGTPSAAVPRAFYCLCCFFILWCSLCKRQPKHVRLKRTTVDAYFHVSINSQNHIDKYIRK